MAILRGGKRIGGFDIRIGLPRDRSLDDVQSDPRLRQKAGGNPEDYRASPETPTPIETEPPLNPCGNQPVRRVHAIEQASRRWRGGRRDDSARTRRKILMSTQRGASCRGSASPMN